MEMLVGFVGYILPFVVLLTVLVFVHEMGHYLVARWNGVRVEVFSVGFGPELRGWTDRNGTRWKLSALPFGGYVKFYGDANAASAPDVQAAAQMTEAERAGSFQHKSVGRRAAIVAAGPAANIVYAIVVLALLFMTFGQRVTPPEIGRVLPNGPGAEAGLRPGDVVQAIDGRSITRFEEVLEEAFLNPDRPLAFEVRRDGGVEALTVTPRGTFNPQVEGGKRRFGELGVLSSNPAGVGQVRPDSPAAAAGLREGDLIVAVDGMAVDSFEALQDLVAASGGRTLQLGIERAGERLAVPVTPQRQVIQTANGEEERWLMGIQRPERPLVRHGPVAAFGEASVAAYDMVVRTAQYIGQMVAGSRGTEDLGGPLRIAQVSGQAAQVGLEQFVLLSVLLSLNLGLINLLPVPVLDGGHLLLYAFEAARGRPLTERMQEYAFRFGLAVILTLTVFATWNDLVNLRVVEFVSGLFS